MCKTEELIQRKACIIAYTLYVPTVNQCLKNENII